MSEDLHLCAWRSSPSPSLRDASPFSQEFTLWCDISIKVRNGTSCLHPLPLPPCVFTDVWACLCACVQMCLLTSVFSQSACEVCDTAACGPLVPCSLEICCCWHFSYGLLRVTSIIALLISWIYDAQHFSECEYKLFWQNKVSQSSVRATYCKILHQAKVRCYLYDVINVRNIYISHFLLIS